MEGAKGPVDPGPGLYQKNAEPGVPKDAVAKEDQAYLGEPPGPADADGVVGDTAFRVHHAAESIRIPVDELGQQDQGAVQESRVAEELVEVRVYDNGEGRHHVRQDLSVAVQNAAAGAGDEFRFEPVLIRQLTASLRGEHLENDQPGQQQQQHRQTRRPQNEGAFATVNPV